MFDMGKGAPGSRASRANNILRANKIGRSKSWSTKSAKQRAGPTEPGPHREPEPEPVAVRRMKSAEPVRAAAKERKAFDPSSFSTQKPPDISKMTKYQKAQAQMYAVSSHQEVVTAKQCIQDSVDRIKRAENDSVFASSVGGLPKLRQRLEMENGKLARYEAKRDRTGFGHTVQGMNYDQLTAKLLETQRQMALLERQALNK